LGHAHQDPCRRARIATGDRRGLGRRVIATLPLGQLLRPGDDQPRRIGASVSVGPLRASRERSGPGPGHAPACKQLAGWRRGAAAPGGRPQRPVVDGPGRPRCCTPLLYCSRAQRPATGVRRWPSSCAPPAPRV
jgi:hypothetical protein